MTVTLRPYQADLIAAVRDEWVAGARNVVMRLDTGGGKTACLAHMHAAHQGASCLMAHRQELVGQLSQTLARFGVRHNLIAAEPTRRQIAANHVAEFGQCYYTPGSPVVVASVDTLIRAPGLAAWAAQVTLWTVDECFPAGTLVDGTPIQDLRVGDRVTAFNEATGGFEPKTVAAVMRNRAPRNMVRVALSAHHVIHCTEGHPFWTRRGWVVASALTLQDEVLRHEMHDVPPDRRYVRLPNGAMEKDGPGVLRQGVLAGICGPAVLGDHGEDQPRARFGSDEIQQPYAPRRQPGANARNVAALESPAESARREWSSGDGRRADAGRSAGAAGLFGANHCADPEGTGERLSQSLQNRLRERGAEDRGRGRRAQSRLPESSGTGREERRFSYWHRLDGIEVYERGNSRFADECADDGFVYNIEVEGLHTYVAEGVVVHNCHHLVLDNKWHRATSMFTHPACRGLMPTATPGRADGKGLGRHADGVADSMVQGPPMRWLIEQGYLTDYRIICPPSDMQVLADPGASGDWSTQQLRQAAQKSHIVGDVVQHYLKWAPGKLGITFCTDVETAIETTAAFVEAGVRAETLTGKTLDHVRRDMLRRYRARELDQLVTVDIVSEGFDLPAIEVASLARPTQSLSLYMQQFGRALRPMEGKGRAIIIDHVSNTVRHGGPPDKPRVWTLDRRDRKAKAVSDAVPLRVCVECFQPYERIHKLCPHCGHYPEPQGRSSPQQVDGDLTELDAATLARMRGEVAAIDASSGVEQARLEARRVPPLGVMAGVKRHRARQEAQVALRESMAAWGGVQHAAGLSDSQMQRLFWHQYGMDTLSAQTLGAADAEALKIKIDGAVNGA